MVARLGDNYLTFTLNEKVTISNPEFILIAVHMTTNKKTACKLGTDLSSYPTRFNSFLVRVVDENATPLSAQLELDEYGFYRYFVYETADADTFNYNTVDSLDLETLTGLIEEGLINYLNVETSPEYYANLKQSIPHYGR